MDTDVIRIFVEVMRRQSFAAVARAHGVDPSSISRAVAGLEEQLGARLFQRTTRKLVPTEAARTYFQHVEGLVEQLDRARQAAADTSGTPRGTVRVTVAEGFAQVVLVPLLPEFCARYPEVNVELILATGFLDLVGERADLAIRLGVLPDSSQVAHRFLDYNFAAVATAAYLRRAGKPAGPEALAAHDCFYYPFHGQGPRWRFRRRDARRQEVEVAVRGRVVANGALVLRGCALLGMGVALLPRWMIGDEVAAGRLVEVLPEWEATATQFDLGGWIVLPSRSYLPARVRVLSDFLREKLGARRRRAARPGGAAG